MNFYLSSNYIVARGCEVISETGKPGLEVPEKVECGPEYYLTQPLYIGLVLGAVIIVVTIGIAIVKKRRK